MIMPPEIGSTPIAYTSAEDKSPINEQTEREDGEEERDGPSVRPFDSCTLVCFSFLRLVSLATPSVLT